MYAIQRKNLACRMTDVATARRKPRRFSAAIPDQQIDLILLVKSHEASLRILYNEASA